MNDEGKIKVKGHIHGILRGPDGKIKEEFDQDNLVVTIGLNNITELLTSVLGKGVAGGGYNLTHIGIGWAEPDSEPSAPALTDTNVPMNGATPPAPSWTGGYQNRKSAVITPLSATQFKLVATWGSGEPATTGTWPKAIRVIGAFWGSGTGNNQLFAWSKRAPINKASADTLEFTYTFTLA